MGGGIGEIGTSLLHGNRAKGEREREHKIMMINND